MSEPKTVLQLEVEFEGKEAMDLQALEDIIEKASETGKVTKAALMVTGGVVKLR